MKKLFKRLSYPQQLTFPKKTVNVQFFKGKLSNIKNSIFALIKFLIWIIDDLIDID